ncbi:MAG TPA: hypothetical protein PLB91_05505 [Spirochaetales bacterium]|nr:hypothetical protein [Spirochaetales bacterium]HRY54930.1 hypothetical protein [Spirochaetia bacterium]HRZ65276.1 hypothetical protein [Spirochaetia bacterium]
MNWITFGIGLAILGYGLFSGIMWFAKPSLFRKLEAMKARWGAKAGAIWHFASYVAVPVLLGILLLVAGSRGVAVFAALG